jgi:hypothetical protein
MSWYTENIKSETAFGSDFLGTFSADDEPSDQGEADQADEDQGGGGGGGGGSPAEPAKEKPPTVDREQAIRAMNAQSAQSLSRRVRDARARERGIAEQAARDRARIAANPLKQAQAAYRRSLAHGESPTVKGVVIKTAPTTALLVVGGLIAATAGALGYKFLSLMGEEHARLTPRRRY